MAEVHKEHPGWLQAWPAPAKLNLMLRITGRRSDGYHLLQTVFQLIDLCDWLVFHPVDGDNVRLKQAIKGVPEAEDLTVRAARLLQKETACRKGVCIEIEKNLPMGGGLGGGSSDAATTLVVLNHLWGLGLSVKTLMHLGVNLGADVPVFVYGYSAWAEGVGEFLQKITLPEKWFVVIKPDAHVDTKGVFSERDLTRNSKSIKMADFIAGQYQNDCQDVVTKRYQSVADAMRALSEFGNARLTGTGACVFVEFDDESVASSAYSALSGCWEVYLAKGLNQSSLQRKLAAI